MMLIQMIMVNTHLEAVMMTDEIQFTLLENTLLIETMNHYKVKTKGQNKTQFSEYS